MKLVNFSSESSEGPILNINEDGYDFDFENDLFMILDGFGGQGIGDRCVNDLKGNLKKFFKNFTVDGNSTLPFFYSPKYLLEGNIIINSMLFSHFELYKENLEKDISERGGASAIIMLKSESVVTLVSTGNCRAYLSRRGEISKIFIEDSMQLLRKDTHQSYLKNVPMSGFGLFPDLHYQVREVRICDGDKLILLTDGAYSRIDEVEINSVLSKPTIDTREKIQDVFNLSNDRGNLDNQTCLIFEY